MSLIHQLIEAGRRIAAQKLVRGSGGNLSGLAQETILVTRSGADLAILSAEDFVSVDRDVDFGALASLRMRPTSELSMHIAAYEARPEAKAVLHVHPPKAISLGLLGRDLPAATPDFYLHLGPLVPLVPYITPTSRELALAVAEKLAVTSAVLLQNHGVLVVGKSVNQALLRLLLLEEQAEIQLDALAIGEPRTLLAEEMRRLDEITGGRYKRR